MDENTLDKALRRFAAKPWWVQSLLLFPLGACMLLALYLVFVIALMSIGFRDGCVNGSPGCAIPAMTQADMVFIPAILILFVISAVLILMRRIGGYKLFGICVLVTLLLGAAPGNDVYALLRILYFRRFSTPPAPQAVTATQTSHTVADQGLAEYKDPQRKFSLLYPSAWVVDEEKPGGRSAHVYAADLYLDFHPRGDALQDHYRIFRGFDIQAYDKETLSGFMQNLRKESPGFSLSPVRELNGFSEFDYDSSLTDMTGMQQIHTQVFQVGNQVLEIRTDRSDTQALQQYIATLRSFGRSTE